MTPILRLECCVGGICDFDQVSRVGNASFGIEMARGPRHRAKHTWIYGVARLPLRASTIVVTGWALVSARLGFLLLGIAAVGIAAVISAWWDGARPHVVAFGSDSAKKALDALRFRLRIHPKDRL